MRYIINITGTVETQKHRNMEVWAKSETEAAEKAIKQFKDAVSHSKSFSETLKDIEIIVKERPEDGNNQF